MPRPKVHLDFETYSDVGADFPRKIGSCKYAEHPSTEILCAAYALEDGEPRVWTPTDPPPEDLFEWIAEGATVHAWNAEFELPVWRHVAIVRLGWPRVPLDRWRDTAVDALVHALPPSLEMAGAALGLDVQKDRRGKHLLNKLSKPRRPTKNNLATRWTPETAPEDFEDLYDYCARDVEAERAVGNALPGPMTRRERALWLVTVATNLRGWAVDLENVDLLRRALMAREVAALREVEELTDGAVRSPRQRDAALDWLGTRGVHLGDLRAETIDATLSGKWRGWGAGGDLPADARRFLEIRRELARASVKKLDAMATRASTDGTVKNNLLHHGASTGRDAGRGVQIQNFPRRSVSGTEAGIEAALRLLRVDDPVGAIELVHGDVSTFASAMLRSMLVARPGRELFAADLSQIENRLLLWYAGCEYGLDVYRAGLCEYRSFAEKFFDVAYDSVTEAQRQRAKPVVLGCGFGMGAPKLQRTAEGYGLDLSDAEARRYIAEYRELYSEVTDLWRGLNRAAIVATRDGVRTGHDAGYGRVEFFPRGEFLMLRLASGRLLAYHRPKVEMVPVPWGGEKRPAVTHMGLGRARKWERVKVTPGRWAENVVQATARDVMMEGALAVTDAGYDLVGRVHDELVAERREGTGDLEEFVALVGASPSWLEGVPIRASGWRGRRYRKG